VTGGFSCHDAGQLEWASSGGRLHWLRRWRKWVLFSLHLPKILAGRQGAVNELCGKCDGTSFFWKVRSTHGSTFGSFSAHVGYLTDIVLGDCRVRFNSASLLTH
jgi:hypothetical protein